MCYLGLHQNPGQGIFTTTEKLFYFHIGLLFGTSWNQGRRSLNSRLETLIQHLTENRLRYTSGPVLYFTHPLHK